MEMRGSPVPTFQIMIRLSLPGGKDGPVSAATFLQAFMSEPMAIYPQ